MRIKYNKKTEPRKVDRSHLVPWLMMWLGDSEIETIKGFLDDFSNYTSDYWFVGLPHTTWTRKPIENYDGIIKIMDRVIPLFEKYNKKIVPFISFGDKLHEQNNLEQYVKDINVRKWIDYIKENLSRFHRVCLGSHWSESGFVPFYGLEKEHDSSAMTVDSKIIINTAIEELVRFYGIVPDLFEKKMVVLNPLEHVFERESYMCRGDLSKAKIRNLFIKYDILGFLPGGAFCRYKNQEEYVNYYGKQSIPGMPLILQREYENRQHYPYEAYTNYLKSGIKLYSGIGYKWGAASHNLLSLIDCGYQGCYCHLHREDVNELFTDIKGWNNG